MSTETIADLDGLKARIRGTWMSGDYDRIAQLMVPAAVEFISRRHLKSGAQVLDVACGTGNLAIAAAAAGAIVAGVDIAPNLLDRARARATQEGMSRVTFREGDAEELPYEDGSFDVIWSNFMPTQTMRRMAQQASQPSTWRSSQSSHEHIVCASPGQLVGTTRVDSEEFEVAPLDPGSEGIFVVKCEDGLRV